MKTRITSHSIRDDIDNEVDMVVDVRGLFNPFTDKKLRSKNGSNHAVARAVMNGSQAKELMDEVLAAAQETKPARIAVVCIGGRHRSVAFANEMGRNLRGFGWNVTVHHPRLHQVN